MIHLVNPFIFGAGADTTPPVLLSIIINAINGPNKAVLTYNEDISTSELSTDRFTISVNASSRTITSVAVSTTTIIVSFDGAPVVYGDDCLMSYAASGGDFTKDLAENPAADFTDEPVDNQIAPSLPTAFAKFAIASLSGLSNNDLVASWANTGSNGVAATESTNKPTYKSSGGANNKPYVEFDGSNDKLQAVFGDTLSEPVNIFLVVKALTTTGGYRFWFAGSASSPSLYGYMEPGGGLQVGTPANVFTGSAAFGSWHIARVLFDGAGSQMWVDGVSIATGNPGSSSLTGVTLGSNFDGSYPGHIQLSEAHLYGALTGDEVADVWDALNAEYAIY